MPKLQKKGKKGNAANFITRTRAVRKLQITLKDFSNYIRRLCILKGIFPREPRKKVQGKDKTYYWAKDIQYLAHEPLLQKIRDEKVHWKKYAKALGRRNYSLAQFLSSNPPKYKLDAVIKERFPTFNDALRDLDDCLSTVSLFAALPADGSREITAERIQKANILCREWRGYVMKSKSLHKVFVSIKGIYYQAEIQGELVTWVEPFKFTTDFPSDVDYRVLLTFLEFYEAVLGFVNFHLYHSINIKYPPNLDESKDEKGEDVSALIMEYVEVENVKESTDDGVTDVSEFAQLAKKAGGESKDADIIAKQLEKNEEYEKAKSLFEKQMEKAKIFVSRETPKDVLAFVIGCFGGTAVWEDLGDISKKVEEDVSITHQVVDRDSPKTRIKGRKYVQPQWIFDSINAGVLLPTAKYAPGVELPAHTSPFVKDSAEGHVPAQVEYQRRMKDIAEERELEKKEEEEEKVAEEEEEDEEKVAEEEEEEEENDDDGEEEDEDMSSDEMGSSEDESKQTKKQLARKAEKRRREEEETSKETEHLRSIVMPRKDRRLYQRIKYSRREKSEKTQLLKSRMKGAHLKEKKAKRMKKNE